MSEVVALFPDGRPATAPDRFAVDRRVRCLVTGRAGQVRMVRVPGHLFVVTLDACRMPVPGGRPPSPAEPAGEMEELPAGDVLRRRERLEPLHPALDPQVIVYVRGRRAPEPDTAEPAPGWCLVREHRGAAARWVREGER